MATASSANQARYGAQPTAGTNRMPRAAPIASTVQRPNRVWARIVATLLRTSSAAAPSGTFPGFSCCANFFSTWEFGLSRMVLQIGTIGLYHPVDAHDPPFVPPRLPVFAAFLQ